MRVVLARLLIVLALAVLIVGSMLAAGRIEAPARYNPFAPLAIDDAPNWLTSMKLARARRDPALCLRVLQQASRMSVSPVADQATGASCGLSGAVRIDKAQPALSPAAPATTCALAMSWAMFEQHGLDAIARETMGSHVARVEHLGVYACRNIYGRAQGRRSEHASANAIDISAFVLADGRRIELARDWAKSAQPERAAFLRRVRDGACRYFNVVLGPEYNEAHRDHFHLDMGRSRVCR